ncbi:hypothetical protein [Xylanimonas sp. McL0601]|uniref:hypothetical protein n=1 Tax=Xylanimonas sp. McL0601 TaxID=3414739 RepID=UPI003CEFD123
MDTTTRPRTTADRQTSARRALAAAAALSGVAALAGIAWLTGVLPGYYPESQPALGHLLDLHTITVIHTITALTGTATGILGAVGALSRRTLVAVGIAEVLVFGFALQSMGTLSTAGYLLALAMPVLVVVLLVQVVRRYRVARWLVGVPGLGALAVGAAVGREALATEAGYLFPALAAQWATIATTLLLVAVGALWALALVRAFAGTDAARRAEDWILRHRRAITIVAATGPLPYALMRLTWLTPWPQLGGAGVDLSTRIWGLTLSSGAWLGFALTLGLIRPWGETFPRWVPGRGGRSVPVAAVAAPGGIVAAVLTFSAVPVLVGLAEHGAFWLALVAFPCWYWGPALALAVWGYVAHRGRMVA